MSDEEKILSDLREVVEYFMTLYRKEEDHHFSDYDCWNLDHYLMELIPSAIKRLVAFGHGYSEHLWMFNTMTTRCDLSADDYKAELLKVAAEFRKACKLTDKAIIKEDVDKAKELRLHCFIWLGHNIGTLWD